MVDFRLVWRWFRWGLKVVLARNVGEHSGVSWCRIQGSREKLGSWGPTPLEGRGTRNITPMVRLAHCAASKARFGYVALKASKVSTSQKKL